MVTPPSKRISLTRLLSRILDKSVLLKHSLNPSFSILSHPLLNPYPDWVSETKSWAIFGTFSDYVIRKILLNLFSNKIESSYVLASTGRRILKLALSDIKDNISTPLTLQLLQNYPQQDIFGFYRGTESYIENFKNPSINWRDSLYEIFRLSHLDRLYREGKLTMPQISMKLIQECIPFFKNIEQWLEYKFSSSKTIYLNPPLGNKETLYADADLVIDSNLYEIKTVLYPEKYISEDFHQLYGYIALFEYLKRHETLREYRGVNDQKIEKIGFIFPLFLQEITMDISRWEPKNRLKYLTQLLSFK